MLRASTNEEAKAQSYFVNRRPAFLGFLKYKLLLQGQGDCTSLLLLMLKEGRQRHEDGQTYYISTGGCGTSVIPCIPAIRAEDHRFDATKNPRHKKTQRSHFRFFDKLPGGRAITFILGFAAGCLSLGGSLGSYYPYIAFDRRHWTGRRVAS